MTLGEADAVVEDGAGVVESGDGFGVDPPSERSAEGDESQGARGREADLGGALLDGCPFLGGEARGADDRSKRFRLRLLDVLAHVEDECKDRKFYGQVLFRGNDGLRPFDLFWKILLIVSGG